MFKQIEFEEFFREKQEPIDIAVLKLTWQNLIDQKGIHFRKDSDDLDDYMYAFLETQAGDLIYLQAYQNYQDLEPSKVTVKLQVDNPNPIKSLGNLLKDLRLSEVDVDWLNPAYDGGSVWKVMRQDDNGHQTTVINLYSEEQAKRMAEYYNQKGHKQLYWVEEIKFPKL